MQVLMWHDDLIGVARCVNACLNRVDPPPSGGGGGGGGGGGSASDQCGWKRCDMI